MAETSSRILVDRTAVRLDGRPFFSFGPRVLLTPPEQYPATLRRIVDAGFNTVGSPPASPGNLWQLHAFFDAAEETGLMVVLMADPRLPYHGRYLADHFRHRSSLHSYFLSPRPPGRQGLEDYQRERDNLRAQDLFHPIFLPLTPDHLKPPWLHAQDLLAPIIPRREGRRNRIFHQQPGAELTRLRENTPPAASRPVFVLGLETLTGEKERSAGLFSNDPRVSRFSPKPLDWYPFLAGFGQMPRRDFLSPVPEILRLQVYDALANEARGAILSFFEGLEGPSPFTGHDRLCEAALLAQEIQIFRDFFAEGRLDSPIEVETGHPRLRAAVLRHGLDHLVVLRMEGYEEDFFVDEAFLDRTEISFRAPEGSSLSAWRMDFPKAEPLKSVRESGGSIRLLAGSLELTGLVLLTEGTQRREDLAQQINERIPAAARLATERLGSTFTKVQQIENELAALQAGMNNSERLGAVDRQAFEAEKLLEQGNAAEAYRRARAAGRYLRQVIKYQMARALSVMVPEDSRHRQALQANYFTLPQFYRTGAEEIARTFTDLT